MKKKVFSLFLAVLLLLSFTFSSNVFAAEVPQLYNISLKKVYNNPTDKEMEQIVSEFMAGNKFAKRVGDKLVDYEAYRLAVIQVIIANVKLSDAEIVNKIMLAMPSILSKLESVKVETPGGDTDDFKVVDIY